MPSPPATWEAVAREVRSARDDSIEKVQPPIPFVQTDKLPLNVTAVPAQLLEPQEIEITELPLEVLIRKLASGTWSSRNVTSAFLRRAAVAQGLVSLFNPIISLYAVLSS